MATWPCWPRASSLRSVSAPLRLLNGAVIAIGKIEPFIVTLGTMAIFRLVWLADGGSIAMKSIAMRNMSARSVPACFSACRYRLGHHCSGPLSDSSFTRRCSDARDRCRFKRGCGKIFGDPRQSRPRHDLYHSGHLRRHRRRRLRPAPRRRDHDNRHAMGAPGNHRSRYRRHCTAWRCRPYLGDDLRCLHAGIVGNIMVLSNISVNISSARYKARSSLSPCWCSAPCKRKNSRRTIRIRGREEAAPSKGTGEKATHRAAIKARAKIGRNQMRKLLIGLAGAALARP